MRNTAVFWFSGALIIAILIAAALVLRPHGTPVPVPQAVSAALAAQVPTLMLDAGERPDYRFDRIDLAASVQRGTRRILFFIPGFNTSFVSGAVTAARIGAVVDPDTLVIYVDWGSKGKALAYRRDGRSAQRNAHAFGHALEYVRATFPHVEFDIFAHSMGSRVAIRGVAATFADHKPVRVQHLVLAAPDVQIGDYVATMRQASTIGRATIYVSRRDKALFLSAIIHFHHRLGQVNVERWNLPRTDIVDVSAEDHSKDGHGYAIHDQQILSDIYGVVTDAPFPHRKWCKSKAYTDVWIYLPPALAKALLPKLCRA